MIKLWCDFIFCRTLAASGMQIVIANNKKISNPIFRHRQKVTFSDLRRTLFFMQSGGK
jgi:hypothetical protein